MNSLSKKPTFGFILLMGALTACAAMAIDLYLPGMPTIAAHYGKAPGAAQATMSAFLIGMAIGQLGFGPLSDRVGRRVPLLFGTLLYAGASLAMVYAPSLEWFTFGRFVQALGACAGVVIARAVIRDRFDTTESARLFSLTFLVLSVAPMFAPTVGGALLLKFGWESIFIVLALFGVVLWLAVLFGLPESRTAATAVQAASESPITAYRKSLADRRVAGFVTAGALTGGALFAYIAASPGLFLGFFAQPTSYFGWIFAVNAMGLIIASQLNRMLLRRYSPAAIAGVGTIFSMIFAGILLVAALTGVATMWLTMVLLFLTLAAIGFVMGNASALALGAMPTRAGTVSALSGAFSATAGALASAATAPFASEGPVAMATAMAIMLVGAWFALRHARQES